MAADFTGQGVLAGTGFELNVEPMFNSMGTLVGVAGVVVLSTPAGFTSVGVLEVAGGGPITRDTTLGISDPTLIQAPTTVVVTLSDGPAAVDVTFNIDGQFALTSSTDNNGFLGPISLPVSEAVGAAGTHTITAVISGATVASGTFTLDRSPSPSPIVRGPDAAAVDVPAANVGGVRRWVLQDLMPGGLGSYVMPWNPSTMTAPHRQRNLDARHTTAQTGQFHVNEGGPAPVEWQFSGFCLQECHDKLLDFLALNRRFYVIDHRERAWKVTFLDVSLVARRRVTPVDAIPTDWGHDYTVTALVYDQDWALVT